MKCPYCVEEIEDGAGRCPLCEEPLGDTASPLDPFPPAPEMYKEDAQEIADLLSAGSKANQALIFSLFGLFCCGIILGPLAIVAGKQANDVYQRYHRPSNPKATTGVILGILALVFHSLYFLTRILFSVMHLPGNT